MKPSLTIDLAGPDGNVFALVSKACMTLDAAGQPNPAMALQMWFRTVPPIGGVSYDDVRRKVEEYCEVTWVNEPRPPAHADALRQSLATIASALGTEAGTPYLVTYDYKESDVTQRCAFICHAASVRGAAENFWNQHPGEWFRLISINNGGIEPTGNRGKRRSSPCRRRKARSWSDGCPNCTSVSLPLPTPTR